MDIFVVTLGMLLSLHCLEALWKSTNLPENVYPEITAALLDPK
jgi:hypothetical protein